MKNLKKDLQAVSKELKALANKTERIMKAVAKLEKAQVKTKAKAKSGKKARAKKPAAKKATAQTATDQVVSIIKRSKKGVDVPTLMKKTSLADKQIRNIVFKASKEGKIKRAGRGIYTLPVMTKDELLKKIEWAIQIDTDFLQLFYKGLTELPPEIGKLTSLKKLQLEANKLEELPKEIGNLTNLERLYLSQNRLSILPTELRRLRKLKAIHLDFNEFVRVPEELVQLVEEGGLKWINFEGNPICGDHSTLAKTRSAAAFIYYYKREIKPWLAKEFGK